MRIGDKMFKISPIRRIFRLLLPQKSEAAMLETVPAKLKEATRNSGPPISTIKYGVQTIESRFPANRKTTKKVETEKIFSGSLMPLGSSAPSNLDKFMKSTETVDKIPINAPRKNM